MNRVFKVKGNIEVEMRDGGILPVTEFPSELQFNLQNEIIQAVVKVADNVCPKDTFEIDIKVKGALKNFSHAL